jgi:guanylate kinase
MRNENWRIRKGGLFVVSAPSGAGKTTLCHEVSKLIPDLKYSISCTTRMPRAGEVNHRDYTFVTTDEFREMIERGEFAEWAEVHGNFYGTPIKELNELRNQNDIILDIDTQGAMQMKRRYGEGVYIFILPPSLEALEERIRKRMANSELEIKNRLKRAREEMAGYKEYEYVIINNDFSEARSELESIILSERCRRERIDSGWVERLINNPPPLTKGGAEGDYRKEV